MITFILVKKRQLFQIGGIAIIQFHKNVEKRFLDATFDTYNDIMDVIE